MTSSFVARYVIAQLRLGHDVKDILATLRVEFRQVRTRSKEKFSYDHVDKLYSKISVKHLDKKYSFNSLLPIYFILLHVSFGIILSLYLHGWLSMLYSFLGEFIVQHQLYDFL